MPSSTTTRPQVEPRLSNTLLPLSDRILFSLAHKRGTARALSQTLRADVQTVHKTLGGLEDEGLVVREPGEGGAAAFRLASDVAVAYRPGRVVVTREGGAAPPAAAAAEPAAAASDAPDGRCRAFTARGTRCKLDSVTDGLCKFHGA